MLHLRVYCVRDQCGGRPGVSTEFERPDNRFSARPPGPWGEVAGQRAQNTTNNPSPLDRALSGAHREPIWRQGIFVLLTFPYPYLSLVEGLNFYA